MNYKVITKDEYNFIENNLELIKKYLYNYYNFSKNTHISIVITKDENIIKLNLRNNPKTNETTWLLINSRGSNIIVYNQDNIIGSYSERKTRSCKPIRNIIELSKDINIKEIVKILNRDILIKKIIN